MHTISDKFQKLLWQRTRNLIKLNWARFFLTELTASILRCMVVLFAVTAKVTGFGVAQCTFWCPLCVCENSSSLSISAWKCVIAVLAIVDYLVRDALDNVSTFQHSSGRVFHEKWSLKILS